MKGVLVAAVGVDHLRALLDRAAAGEAPDDLTDEALLADTRRETVH